MPLATHALPRFALALFIAGGFGMSPAMAGDLVIVGSGDGQDILRSIAMAYSAQHPATRVLVPPGIGSSGAVVAVGHGRNALGRMSRPLNAGEQAAGIELKPLLRLPVAIIAHPDLPLDGLKGQQVAALFSGSVTNWREFGGTDQRVRVVRREDGDAAMQALVAAVPALTGGMIVERARVAAGSQEIIEIVASTPGALAVIPYSASYRGMAKVLALDSLRPWEPAYPALLPLGLIYRSGQMSEEARNFLAFAVSQESAAIIARFGARAAAR